MRRRRDGGAVVSARMGVDRTRVDVREHGCTPTPGSDGGRENAEATMRGSVPMRARFAAGILPAREGLQGELRRLTAARDAALRSYHRWLDDDAVWDYGRAQGRLDAFLREHPEVAT